MGGNVVLTYKRRRVSSRTNEPRINTCSQTTSNSSANIMVKREPTDGDENIPQKMPEESKKSREHYDEVGLNLLQCENCSTTQNHAEHIGDANKRQKLCSSCTKQQGSTPSDHTGKSSVLEDKSQSSKSEFLKSNDISISEKCASEETDKLPKDQSATSCTNLDTEQRLSLTLRTFSRRSKEKRNISEPNNAANPDATIQLMDAVDADTKEALTSEEKVGDNPCTEAENSQSAAVQLAQCSIYETSVTQGHEGIQVTADPRHIDCNQPLDSGSDIKNLVAASKAHFSVEATPIRETESSLPKQNAENCSRAEATVVVKSEELDSSSERDYLQLFPESRSNGMPLGENERQKPAAFMEPEEKRYHLQPPLMQPLHPYSSHPRLEQMINTRPPYPPLYGWHNNLHPQSRETFHNFLQSSSDQTAALARQNLMFNNLLPGNGAARGNQSNFQNMFKLRPNTWLEEELDCLWVGVRRHGKGNWEAMLRDQKLHFLPWKAPLDLAQRWEEEQFRVVYGRPVSQQYAPRQDSPCANFLYQQSVLPNFMVNKSRRIQNPGPFPSHGNYGSSNMGFTPYESGVKGNFPHWMREAAVIPSKPSEPVLHPSLCQSTETSEQPTLNNSSVTSILTHNELQNSITAPSVNPTPVIGHPVTEACEQVVVKEEEMVIDPNEASSEGTVSDDLTVTR